MSITPKIVIDSRCRQHGMVTAIAVKSFILKVHIGKDGVVGHWTNTWDKICETAGAEAQKIIRAIKRPMVAPSQ